jgi:hypothetical protein
MNFNRPRKQIFNRPRKHIFFVLSLLAFVSLAYQNCAPPPVGLLDSLSEVSSAGGQKIWVSEEVRSTNRSSDFSLKSKVEEGDLVSGDDLASADDSVSVQNPHENSSPVAPSSPVMIIAERVTDPELLCAGGCPLEYDFLIETTCGRVMGKLLYGFNEGVGEYESKIRFDQNTISAVCTDVEARIFEALSADGIQLERQEDGSLLLVSSELEVKFVPRF